MVLSKCMSRSRIAGSYGNSFLRFSGISILFHTVVQQFTSPPTVQEGSLFSMPSPAFIFLQIFDDGHSGKYEAIPHCSSDLHFSKLATRSALWCASWPSVCLLWRNVYLGLVPVLWLGCLPSLFSHHVASDSSRSHGRSTPGFPACFVNVHFSGPTGIPVKHTFQVQSTEQSSFFPEEGWDMDW